MEPTTFEKTRPRFAAASGVAALVWALFANPAHAGPPVPVGADPFARVDLPDDWEAAFWAGANARALFALGPKAVADLVPVQAGIRFCRCPACDAPEADDPLAWSVARPTVLTCRRCQAVVPNKKFPAKDEKEKAVPEEAVEVRPGVTHHYPYHAVEPDAQQYPGERLYLAAKRDGEAREFLAKAALYAAVRHRERPDDPARARLASVILLRFAQVYPSYATHYDQPTSLKFFQRADLPPPYRKGYATARWDWTGSQDVPLDLVIAYGLLRGDPALAEAGRLLDEPDPARVIERDLFRASAEFVRRQPEEVSEAALQADRGILAVGRLLNDPVLVHDALTRLDRFAERGFYFDGFWRQGTLAAHRRVVGQLDGWIDRLLAGYSDPEGPAPVRGGRRLDGLSGAGALPMIALARTAGAAVLTETPAAEVRQAAWPAPPARGAPRAPALLGGTGIARLAVGHGDDALDVELRGLDAFGPAQIQRQALRVAVGGRTVLGDLDEVPGTPTGFDHATVSRNTVAVDGLNQRESLPHAGEPAPGGNFVFFAADPDFQVVTLDDPRAYPQSTTRYRQTVIASAGPRSRYALAVFEVEGGLQHDQMFHGPAGSPARWGLSVPTAPGPRTLLPPGLTFVPSTHPEDGRWFVQSFGEFAPTAQARLDRPAQAGLNGSGPDPVGIRLHLLNNAPLTAVAAVTPDPTQPGRRGPADDAGRGSLVLRRRSEDGATLRTTFVTLFEPVGKAVPPLKRVGRAASTRETVVVLYLETADGPEHVVVNLTPGKAVRTRLADGRTLATDGLAVRLSAAGLVLAGGTFAEAPGGRVRQPQAAGRVTGSVRRDGPDTRGWFETDTPLPDPASLAGRQLVIRHGDGTTRAWTLHGAENVPGGARLHVREEPGFEIDAGDGSAHYYQFPGTTYAGPHRVRVSRIARVGGAHFSGNGG